jgi:Taurine catabolism dioxygenase TauD, TfdA family
MPQCLAISRPATVCLRSMYPQLKENGWAVISPELANDVPEIIRALGPITPPTRGEFEYRDLVPYDIASAPQWSMSSIVGTGEQPMHTDCAYHPTPPRFVALHCLCVGECPCSTHLWVADLGSMLKDRPKPLADPKWVFQGGGHSSFYCSIMEVRGGEVRMRFDPLCMRLPSAGPPPTDEAQSTLRRYTQHLIFEWQQGSTLVIDNWRCLHARGAGAEKSPSRKLRRWGIEATHGLGN